MNLQLVLVPLTRTLAQAHWREGCMYQQIGEVDRLCILAPGFWWYRQTPTENLLTPTQGPLDGVRVPS
jgi:hypothetical protein